MNNNDQRQRLNANGVSEPASVQKLLRISICQENGTPVPADLVDMARLDLLFLTDRPLRFGTVLQTAVYCDLVTGVSYNKAVVHYCRATLNGWEIGAFLTAPVPDYLAARYMDELRGQLRYECDWKAWVHWERTGRLDSVRVISYSINGLRLRMEQSVEAGSDFSIFSSSGTTKQPILNGRVRWCRISEGGYTAGCMVSGQRGRELPRMFGNLTAIHVSQAEVPMLLHSGESPEMLLSKLSEPECFRPVQ